MKTPDRCWRMQAHPDQSVRELPPGFIFHIAKIAGLDVSFAGKKLAIRCPVHKDEHASAFLSPNNIFYCSVCTPSGGWPAKRFAGQLGVDWLQALRSQGTALPHCPRKSTLTSPSFTPLQASEVWGMAHARAQNEALAESDAAVYRYLRARSLLGSRKLGSFGVLAAGMRLPWCIARWPALGYRIVAPLYDLTGNLVNIQARAIRDTRPKTRFPSGSMVKGTVFADARGIVVLRGRAVAKEVLLGEGLTDFLALSIASPIPVICVPGAGVAASAIGAWVRGLRIRLALDHDATGDIGAEAASNAAKENGASEVLRHTWPEGCKDACEVVEQFGLQKLGCVLAPQSGGQQQ